VVAVRPVRVQNGIQDGQGTAVLTQNGRTGQLSRDVMYGHPHIKAHGTDRAYPESGSERPLRLAPAFS
jgi:hypothetical protein